MFLEVVCASMAGYASGVFISMMLNMLDENAILRRRRKFFKEKLRTLDKYINITDEATCMLARKHILEKVNAD